MHIDSNVVIGIVAGGLSTAIILVIVAVVAAFINHEKPDRKTYMLGVIYSIIGAGVGGLSTAQGIPWYLAIPVYVALVALVIGLINAVQSRRH